MSNSAYKVGEIKMRNNIVILNSVILLAIVNLVSNLPIYAEELHVPKNFPTIQSAIDAPTKDFYYVDDNGSNETGDGSPGKPWKTITFALSKVSKPGSTIFVAPGTYNQDMGESFPLKMKGGVSIVSDVPEATILDANGSHAIECKNISGGNMRIQGFTIREGGSYSSHEAGGIRISNSSSVVVTGNIIKQNEGAISINGSKSSVLVADNIISGNYKSIGTGAVILVREGTGAIIANNVIIGNQATWRGSGVIYCEGASPLIINNTVSGNNECHGLLLKSANPIVINNIIYDNSRYGIFVEDPAIIPVEDPISFPSVSYNLFYNNKSGVYNGYRSVSEVEENIPKFINNLEGDPMFVDADSGNYHLLPGSPAIDAGNPDPLYNDRDGTRNDIGAYGGTLDLTPPAILSVKVTHRSATIVFSEPVIVDDAKALGNYILESPIGEKVSLSGNPVSYNDTTRTAPIDRLNLQPGDTFRINVQNIRDIWFNSIDPMRNTADGVVMQNTPPALSGGKVIPESGHEKTEFIFRVVYADADNDPPSIRTVLIDNEYPRDMARLKGDESFINGEVFEYKTTLKSGSHTYRFAASDGASDASGDTTLHSGPITKQNTALVLSNGTISPSTGTKGTQFLFTVIYSDAENDAPSEITIQVDGDTPVKMSRVDSKDTDYTDGAVYGYKTRLSEGIHTFSFTAKDFAGSAIGDTVVFTGPIVTSSGVPSVLLNGSVTPHIGTSDTEFAFEVVYTSPDNEQPSEVTVKIDGEVASMSTDDKNSMDCANGVTYRYKTKLGMGKHTYAFAAKSGEMEATGDTGIHSGPNILEILPEKAITPVPGEWQGFTDKGVPVSFTVSENSKSIVYGDQKINISNQSFAVSESDQINFFDTYSWNWSGSFASPNIAKGEFSDQYIRRLSGKIDKDSWTWWAMRPYVTIDEPKDNAMLTNPSIKVSGSAAGPLVASAEVNGKPVKHTASGFFSTDMELTEGANAIKLIAFDSEKGIVGNYSISVTLDTRAPVVKITEPKDKFTTPNSRITVRGTVDDPSIIYADINNTPVCVINGIFTTTLSLLRGLNFISAKAADRAGNEGISEIQVTYDPDIQLPPVETYVSDVNRDGVTDISDLSLVGKSFGRSLNDGKTPEWSSIGDGSDADKADLNDDGVVDILDAVLVAKRLDEGAKPSAAPPDITDSKHTAKVQISKINKLPDGLLKAYIEVASEAELYGFQFDMHFDPHTVEIVTVSEEGLLKGGDVQTYWCSPKVDNQAGMITNAASTRLANAHGVKGNGVLASIVFRLKDSQPNWVVSLNLASVRLIDSEGRFIPAVVTGINRTWEDLAIPERSDLLNNYPNPFNPETWIPYQLSKDSDVTISIYNISGQLVRRLNLGYKPAGVYVSQSRSAHWDGKNEFGEYTASGTYFYSIKAGEFAATRKMIMLK